MKLTKLILLLLISPVLTAPQTLKPPKITALRCGKLIDVKSGVEIDKAIVLIEGERIRAVGQNLDIPAKATVIDLSKLTVLPGLIDCHTHLLEAYDGAIGDDEANIILTVVQMSTAQRALMGAALGREELEAGITTVRDLGNSGLNGDVALREAINAGWVVGPRICAATRALSVTGGEFGTVAAGSQKVIEQEYAIISGVEEARRAVRQAVFDGADCIKIIVDAYPRMLSLAEMKTIVEEAHQAGKKVAAHALFDPAVRLAVEAGVDSIEHGFTVSDDVLKVMAEKRIYLVPTDWNEQFRYEAFLQPRNLSPEELRQLQGEAKARAASRRERLRRAIKMGVPIAAGSDIYYKVKGRTRGEVSKMIFVGYAEAGMTPLAIIRAATLNAAELIGWQNQIGSLEPNKLADIIAVEGDPLKDVSEINRVRFVMKGGLVITNQTGLQSPQRQVNEH